MFWKWTSLIFFLTTILLGSFFISNYYSFKQHHNREKISKTFEKRLKLDENQKKKFEAIDKDYTEKMKILREEHKKLIDKLDSETVSFSNDPRSAKEISRQIILHEGKMRELTIDFFFNLKSILTDQQKEEFKKIFKEKKNRKRSNRMSP